MNHFDLPQNFFATNWYAELVGVIDLARGDGATLLHLVAQPLDDPVPLGEKVLRAALGPPELDIDMKIPGLIMWSAMELLTLSACAAEDRVSFTNEQFNELDVKSPPMAGVYAIYTAVRREITPQKWHVLINVIDETLKPEQENYTHRMLLVRVQEAKFQPRWHVFSADPLADLDDHTISFPGRSDKAIVIYGFAPTETAVVVPYNFDAALRTPTVLISRNLPRKMPPLSLTCALDKRVAHISTHRIQHSVIAAERLWRRRQQFKGGVVLS